ncbi:DgyrCDS13439 [Dimorphilus gyrociliatus]|uniref:DgyrCDS13439 n=1 Tax=Dimorphilus gyrociliatus TaxID=2664684 RepID=A0A7I8WAN1_9ANNE|nr:DgyrCDS13439 [Dimorphilus gyrociliatus]
MKTEDELSIPLTPESQRSNYSSIDQDLDKKSNKDVDKKNKELSISFSQLFNYADFWDIILIVFSSLLACLHGISIPILVKKIGEVVEDFVQQTNESEIRKESKQIAALGFGVFIVSFLQLVGWKISSQRQSYKIREALFKRVLQREISWFQPANLKTAEGLMSKTLSSFERGMGDNLGLVIHWCITFGVALVISFTLNWKLAIVLFAASFVIAFISFLNKVIWCKLSLRESECYSQADDVVQQALDNIDTVTAFDGSEKESLKYNDKLLNVQNISLRKNTTFGVFLAVMLLLEFGSYTLGFWYGPKILYDNKKYDLKKIITIIFLMRIILLLSIERICAYLKLVNESKVSAASLYPLLLTKPSFRDGEVLPSIKGNISFEKVFYKVDNEIMLNDFSFQIESGETLAIVDISRKSTHHIFELLLRYHFPNNGLIKLDGYDISTLNWKCLQRACGFLPKLPEVFSVSVEENLRFGNENATIDEITEVCRLMGVFNYINSLPRGFETILDKEIYLPAIEAKKLTFARLYLRNSKIVLLDQPFFNLKNSEATIIQKLIDVIRQDRTVIILENDLEKVKDFERLIITSGGEILEEGTIGALQADEESLYSRLTSTEGEKDNADEEDTCSAYDSMEMFEAEDGIDRSNSNLHGLLRKNYTKTFALVCGILFSLICGAVIPTFAIIFSKILGNLKDIEKRNYFSYLFLALGGIAFIAFSLKAYFLSKFSIATTARLRTTFLKGLLNQDIAYLKNPNTNIKDLIDLLTEGIEDIENLIKNRMGTSFQSLAAFISGFVIACICSWKIALLGLGFLIFTFVILHLESRLNSSMLNDNKAGTESVKLILNETFQNVRTVTQFGKEDWMIRRFKAVFDKNYCWNIVKCIFLSLLRSLVFSLIFFALAASFILSVKLIRDDKIDYVDVFRSITAILIGILVALYFQAIDRFNYSRSIDNIKKLLALLCKKPSALDAQSKIGIRPGSVYGILSFQDVWFSHPATPDVPILRGVNFRVKKGESLALVGDVGKNTCFSLLERFYDPTRGLISLDDNPIERLNTKWLRNQIGLVDGKGFIFDGTIADAIAYGDNSRLVDMDEVINAAKKANVHDFIANLPHGYFSIIGKRGYKLSLNHLQRICIARALLRRPKILLLDNATSSLDIESEIIVQAALEEGQRNRTTIIISDRLSSIHNADKIAVIKQGRIVEMGDHSTLIDKSGIYYSMYVAETKTFN